MGGYSIIDFKEIDVSGSGATIAGIYDKIEGARKALLIHGLNNGTLVMGDFFGCAEVVSGDFVITFGGHKITIDDDDKVVYATI